MDIMDWMRENNEKYGTSDEDWGFLNNAGVVRFDYDEKGYVSGMYHGKTVYRDSYHEADIVPGDIWIVSLSLNPKTGANYFAKPLMKIDGSFLYQMKKDQIDSLAKYLWDNNRVILEPVMEEIYKDVAAEQIANAVKEQTAALESQIEKLKDDLSEQQRLNAEDKAIIESMEKENELLSAKVLVMENSPGVIVSPQPIPEVKKQTATESTEEFKEQVKPPKSIIIRTGPDTIRSDGFGKARYFVHMSSDHSRLLIRDDKNGNVVCMEKTITLSGLNSILPFSEECVMQSEYSPKYGGILVYLK